VAVAKAEGSGGTRQERWARRWKGVVIVAILSAAVDVASDAATVEAFVTVPCRTAESAIAGEILAAASYTRFCCRSSWRWNEGGLLWGLLEREARRRTWSNEGRQTVTVKQRGMAVAEGTIDEGDGSGCCERISGSMPNWKNGDSGVGGHARNNGSTGY